MKSLKIILLVLGIGTAALAFGQEESDIFTRHEVSLGYGFIPSTSMVNARNSYYCPTNEYFGSISASYTYKFNKVIGIGTTLSYDNNNFKIYDSQLKDVYVCDVKQNIVTALVHVKVNWVRTKVVTMYSKVGLGGSYYGNDVKQLDDNYIINDKDTPMKKAGFNYSIVPVGIELGNKQYAAFLQTGFGAEGFFSIGFRYGINKTYKQ